MTEYDFKSIEARWQAEWERIGLFIAKDDDPRPKYYVLTMYPYPSGVLHMGHVINYTLGDVVARYKILRGFSVLSPMGWDSFGLPAENAAIRTGVHPHEFTEKNIGHMRRQMRRAGWGYDWSRELATSHPDYYRWTQWLFLRFLKAGKAVKKTAPVNWCPSCQTVLANEQVMGDGSCERCGTAVGQKDMNQWFFRMSAEAESLLQGLDQLRGAWPDSVVAMQEEWIGKSVGAQVHFTVKETGDPCPVFTTRPDTLRGVTFMAIAPEHPLVEKLVKGSVHERRVWPEVLRLRQRGTSEKELAEREKEGVFTGFHVVNPTNGEAVPLWVANFALMSYGTGAVMSVPAHDQRDWEFAKKYDLPIRRVIAPPDGSGPESWDRAFTAVGVVADGGPFDGAPDNQKAIPGIIDWLVREGIGEKRVNYRLRDWLLSRQRYWGAPIPVINCPTCGIVPVPEEELPVLLPTDVRFKAGGGNPLASSESFVNVVCPACGNKDSRRETDTMDTFVDSSWYFARYADPKNESAPCDAGKTGHWMPVDLYIGGIEHATMHLIYARVFGRWMHELGLIPNPEPFARLFCQGMVCKWAFRCPEHKWLAEADVVFAGGATPDNPEVDGGSHVCAKCGKPAEAEMTKISKSKLNIVDPDRMMDQYGADTVRLYMLSDAPPDRMNIWSENGINGAWRTLNRLWTLLHEAIPRAAPADAPTPGSFSPDDASLRRKTHQCIRRVTAAIEEGFQFNTAIARVNELLNLFRPRRDAADPWVVRETLETVVRLLSPIVPHFAEECWKALGRGESLFASGWPEIDEDAAREAEVEIPVQINGKVRARLTLPAGLDKAGLEKAALSHESLRPHLEGKTVVKVVAVPDRIVNIAVK